MRACCVCVCVRMTSREYEKFAATYILMFDQRERERERKRESAKKVV